MEGFCRLSFNSLHQHFNSFSRRKWSNDNLLDWRQSIQSVVPAPDLSAQNRLSCPVIENGTLHFFSQYLRPQRCWERQYVLDLLCTEGTAAAPLVIFPGKMFGFPPKPPSLPRPGFLRQRYRPRVRSDCLLGGLHLVLAHATLWVQNPLVRAIPEAAKRGESSNMRRPFVVRSGSSWPRIEWW